MQILSTIIAFIYKLERICCGEQQLSILPITDAFDLTKCKDFDLDQSIFVKKRNYKGNVIPFDISPSSFEFEPDNTESKVCYIV